LTELSLKGSISNRGDAPDSGTIAF
jgi:hypothetical protein